MIYWKATYASSVCEHRNCTLLLVEASLTVARSKASVIPIWAAMGRRVLLQTCLCRGGGTSRLRDKAKTREAFTWA